MPIEKFVVSRDDHIYEAWPDIALTDGGRLICVFAECTHHRDRSYTRIVMKKSLDRGRTWTAKLPLTEGTNGLPYWNCPRISKLRDGSLVIVCDQIAGEKETKGTVHIWFGDPEGEQWNGPIQTPVQGIVPDKLCELPGGRWLLSAHYRDEETRCPSQYLWYSDNRGESWTGPVTVASQDGMKLCEGSILPLPDGTLAAFLRENSGLGLDCFKAISKDQGETWEGMYPIPLPGCHRPVAGMLQSGNIMITYRFMQGGKGWVGKSSQNFFAALTDAESVLATERKQQWTRIMPIDFDRSSASDLGYSGWVQFADGEIYMVNYIVDDAPNGQIRGYSLREEDFILG